jgi:prepilin-type N-terminal cleavage/methylation domain-containing protein
MSDKFFKKNQGVTLIEIMVVLTIFSIFLTAVIDIFMNTIKVQRNAFAAQTLQETARQTFETISKDIKWGVVLNSAGTSDFLTGSGSAALGLCVKDEVNNTRLIRYFINPQSVLARMIGNTAYPLTPPSPNSQVMMDPSSFTVEEATNGSKIGKYVTFDFNFKYKYSPKAELKIPNLQIKTSIEARYIGSGSSVNVDWANGTCSITE